MSKSNSKGPGCVFYGCLTFVILIILIVGGVYYATNRWMNNMVANFTSPTPKQLPELVMDPAEANAVLKRVDEFRKAMSEGRPAEPIRLSGDEINALLAYDDAFKDFKDKFYVTIEGDEISADMNWPFDDPPLKRLKGRYLVGRASLALTMEGRKPALYLRDLNVNGNELPKEAKTAFENQNFLEALSKQNKGQKDPFEKFESIEIIDGQLIIVPKNTPESPAELPTPENAEPVGATP